MTASSPLFLRYLFYYRHQSLDDHHFYDVNINGSKFTVTVTASATVAHSWACEVRNENLTALRLGTVVVGIAIEVNSETMQVATIQLCIGARCLVFQLVQAEEVPQSLRNLLMEPACRFFSFSYDHRRILLESRHAVELGSDSICITPFLPGHYAYSSFEVIVTAYLGYGGVRVTAYLGYGGVRLTEEVFMSNWNVETLSNEQVMQVSLEARCAFLFGRLILSMGI